MKFIDLLCVVSDNTNVDVIDADGFVVAQYNGKDSLDDIPEDTEIAFVEVVNDTLNIWVLE